MFLYITFLSKLSYSEKVYMSIFLETVEGDTSYHDLYVWFSILK